MGSWQPIAPAGNHAYLAKPESGSGPGVLVLHAWWGLTPWFAEVCDHLAAHGYVAYAPSLYPDRSTTADITEAGELAKAAESTPGTVEHIARTAIAKIRSDDSVTSERIAIIGYSLGAWWALHFAQEQPEDVAAVVTYYGLNDDDYSNANAAFLGHFGELDDYEPLDSVKPLEAQMRAAGHDATLHVYPGAGHWFVESNRPDAYDADASDLAWTRTLEFLAENLT